MDNCCRHWYRDVANLGSIDGLQKAIDCSFLSIMPTIFGRNVRRGGPGMPWQAYHRCHKEQYYWTKMLRLLGRNIKIRSLQDAPITFWEVAALIMSLSSWRIF